MSHCVVQTCEHHKNNTRQRHFLLNRYCLDIVFVSIFSELSVLHTRWWFSLVPDPIIYASVLVGTGKRCHMCS